MLQERLHQWLVYSPVWLLLLSAGTMAIREVSGEETTRFLVVNPASPRASDENPGNDDRPLKTIGRAATLVQAGDVVRIHTGVYRETVVITASGTPEKPIRFESAPGAYVVVTGADLMRQWRKEPSPEGENVFSTDWPHRFLGWSKTGAVPDDEYHRLIGRAEQVIWNGYLLRQVLSREKLTWGTFFADLAEKRLYVQTDNNADLLTDRGALEASVRGTLWEVQGDYVQTRGITFRYSANGAQRGMVRLQGRGATVEDCVFEWANTVGVNFLNEDQAARRCVFRDNGQEGFSASHAHRLRLIECIVARNNIKNFDRDWEAGGCKICLSRDVLVEQCHFLNNHGHGIWFDIGNEGCTVRNCLIEENDDAGIFYEISYGLHAHDNVILFNGFHHNPAAWGANGGISLSSSPECRIERNLILGNREGFQFREQYRQTPRIDVPRDRPAENIWNHDEHIEHNMIAFSRDAHVWGWFDVSDQRHWPASVGTKLPLTNDVAEKQAVSEKPQALSLEQLALKFEGNLYFGQPSQGTFVWGPAWRNPRRYRSLQEVRKELGLETGQEVASLPFADFHARDLRLPADHPAIQQGCYPEGKAPGVVLGTLPPKQE